jgi:hypothetical protein
VCKCGNIFSLPVLIGRAAWPQNNSHDPIERTVISITLYVLKQIVVQVYPFFGGDSEEATPVPISNTEVKLFSADGTARAAVWESRTPPNSFILNPESLLIPGFFIELTFYYSLSYKDCIQRSNCHNFDNRYNKRFSLFFVPFRSCLKKTKSYVFYFFKFWCENAYFNTHKLLYTSTPDF